MFEIVTDSCSDLPEKIIKQFNIHVVSLSFFVDDTEYLCYEKGRDVDCIKYYDMMKEGKMIKTSLANEGRFRDIFEPILESGKDVLYISVSSGISGTYAAGLSAAGELEKEYPDRKIIIVDSLSGSLGQGLLVYYAAFMKERGKSIFEIEEWLENNKLKILHEFTVDDLDYFKRGGRISSATAVIGKFLSIKPLLRASNEGKIYVHDKIRGRKASLDRLIKYVGDKAIDIKEQVIAISHAGCEEDAKYIEKEIKMLYKVKKIIVNDIDLVMGAHAGPGMIGVFFIGFNRA